MYRNSVANCRKAWWDRWIRMGAPPRRTSIGTRPPPIAPPWPICPKTIFSGSGELASKRGGGRGNSHFDGQIDGQIIKFLKTNFPKKNEKSEVTFYIQFLKIFPESGLKDFIRKFHPKTTPSEQSPPNSATTAGSLENTTLTPAWSLLRHAHWTLKLSEKPSKWII